MSGIVLTCLCIANIKTLFFVFLVLFFFFFFQAEDGIRDDLVTGVQTCALPISIHIEGEQLQYIFLLACLLKGFCNTLLEKFSTPTELKRLLPKIIL